MVTKSYYTLLQQQGEDWEFNGFGKRFEEQVHPLKQPVLDGLAAKEACLTQAALKKKAYFSAVEAFMWSLIGDKQSSSTSL